MREIVLDTETTGLDPLRGDRLVEIGCVEMVNCMPTGQTFHRHINPERSMPAEAFNVHGLSSEFLADKPLFAQVVDEFLEFIADAPLVIHNASFDIGFINAELDRIKRPADCARPAGRHAAAGAAQASGGVEPARRSLLALRDRQFPPHQARRLARRRTAGRGLYRPDRGPAVATDSGHGDPRCARRRGYGEMPRRVREAPLAPRVTDEDRAAHRAFVATLGDKPIWNDFLGG